MLAFHAGETDHAIRLHSMTRGFALLLLAALAGCGETDQAPAGLTADENRRLENAARMLDERREATTPDTLKPAEPAAE